MISIAIRTDSGDSENLCILSYRNPVLGGLFFVVVFHLINLFSFSCHVSELFMQVDFILHTLIIFFNIQSTLLLTAIRM